MISLADLKQQTQRHYRQIVAFVAGIIVVTFLAFLGMSNRPPMVVTEAPTQEKTEIQVVGTTMERSAPVVIRIPKINLETEFEGAMGLNTDGTIEVPDSYEEVGWYQYGPTPGELGPAVVLGHVDSYEGPAVFWSLGQLDSGDLIYIDRADGSTATFEITKLEKHDQSDFPTAKVYGDIDHAGLRLITCSGTYDKETLRYTHNLIVFAKLVE